VEAKSEKLKISRRPAEGYNVSDLQMVFGESRHKVERWLDRGLLGRVTQRGGRCVSDQGVLRFMRVYIAEYDLRRVDQTWFKSMVFGVAGAEWEGQR
jgi:hypothetical protein